MNTSGRLLLATAISIVFLFVYDRLVIRPRVEKHKVVQKTHSDKTSKAEDLTEKRAEFTELTGTKPTVLLTFQDEFQKISVSERGVSRIELTNFALRPNSVERYFFESPIDVLFSRDGKILNFSARISGDVINLYYDGVTGAVSLEKLSHYTFAVRYEFFNSSSLQSIDLTPVIVVRRSVQDDSKLVVLSPKVKMLGDLKSGEKPNFIGEDTRYFSLLFFVPGGASYLGSNMFYGQKLLGEKYVDFYVKFFAGPKVPEELSAFSEQAKELAGYGFFGPISEILILTLEKLNKVIGNMGISIIVLSILIRLLFFPLSAISLRSFKKIKDLQPEIEKIKEKYKDDKDKMGREIFELYRREKINPFSGCLPLLIQIPIFIALYNALMHSIDLRHASFALWIKDLSEPDTILMLKLGGLELPLRLLPLLMGLSFFVQQMMTPQVHHQDQGMKIINYLMPVIFTFILWNVPSGLQLYWITTNVVGVLQQILVTKFYK